MEAFSKKIKEIRKENNMSQSDLGQLLGVTFHAVSKWETCGKEPSYTILVKIAKRFNVTTDYLLGLED